METNSCQHCQCEISADDDYCADCQPTCNVCGKRLDGEGDTSGLCADCQEDAICPACNGSGEGMHDGTRCHSCGGGGTDRRQYEPDPDDWHDYGRE